MKPRPWLRLPLQLMTIGLALWAVPGSAAVAAPASPTRHMAMPAAAQSAQVSACDPTASLRPAGPPVVTAGSFMAKIRARGFLIAGVGQTTFHFGYLNPLDGKIEGFDIDIVRAIAAAIFGNPDKVEFRAVTSAQRISDIHSDDSILAGLGAQDPRTKIVGPRFSNEPYGLAISRQHPDFVRFVNAVLQRLRADGQWAASYARWIGTPAPPPPPARYKP